MSNEENIVQNFQESNDRWLICAEFLRGKAHGVSHHALPAEARKRGEGGESGSVGQIVEFTPSRPRRYYLVLITDAGSVPCSTTNSTSNDVQNRPETRISPFENSGFLFEIVQPILLTSGEDSGVIHLPLNGLPPCL
jgi:hypothetical protein